MTPEARWQTALLELIARQEQPPDDTLGLDAAGLAVYRNNYRLGLMDTLKMIYPVCGQIVGEEFFTGLAREYSKRNASLSGNLHEYGGLFGDFLQGFPPAQTLPYLADVARLEWAVHRSYYAIDQQALTAVALTGVAAEHYGALQFRLPDSCTVLSSPWPIVGIWQGHQPGHALEVNLDAGGEAALVQRNAGRVGVTLLSPGMAALLHSLQQGETLGQAAEQALQAEADFDLQAALLHLFTDGLITEFHL
ncbi:DNA-binding domain-containing protein [Aquitalea sp. LB_tupeE]|uniref:HvfC/BufC N-terminal domain-containing protein n=1 Tax=Aquitalea sp. LB_tupeE TaxID=2748078 RepID=UPI0015BEB369|nr:DNA-binding domain-containing protein [Aquitalea sp. LB_tupeE]NWK78617.1 putative DNA-binding domain-containing protein [Aquitalea sp. LB_tupeE]